ncbi:uncharacterized protein LOC125520085 [Triticum urartu]|uniref:PHD and RING finger domain-containing protein 1 n=1 Tax=Triticum urartu TaxID=4572 RepID=A0A8R7R149_TRIUA|nr:uncharacterized protein LOC125520085 [Triticum urartu]
MSSSAGDGLAPPSSASKGKARMDDDAEAVAAAPEGVPCGICFTDSRRAIRGELDCCAHHFCFVCIMAWARVESRCPFCKARFHTIRRPPVPGRLPSERIVNVAERNQVYHPRGNVSSVVSTDPYVNSRCSVCNCSSDEDLLLLCELCDAASHTYCVGLGTTVPEGDWFCKDCETSKEEHSRCQIEDGGSSDQGEIEITIEVPTAEPVTEPSASDIVDEGSSLSSVRRTNTRSSGTTIEVPTAEPVTEPSVSDIVDEGYSSSSLRCTNTRSSGTTIEVPTVQPVTEPPVSDIVDGSYSLSSLRHRNTRSSGPIPVPSIYDNVDEDYGTIPVHGTNAQSSGSFPVPSVYDIVDEDYEINPLCRTNTRSTRPDRNANDLPSQGNSSDGSYSHESPQGRGTGRALLHAHARFGTERARTFRNSRNLNNRIMLLRENWPALRAGSAGFATHLHNNSASSSVKEHQQSAAPPPKETRYVNKAWKMLEMAKSAGGRKKCDKPSSLDCTPRFSMGNRSTSFSPIDTILGQKKQSLSPTVTQRNAMKFDRGAKRDNILPRKDVVGHCDLPGNRHVLVCEGIGSFQSRMTNQESPNGKVASSSHSQHVDQTPESSCGGKVALSSHRQHVDQTLESVHGLLGSGKPKMDALHPSANSLSSGRPTAISPLQIVSSAGNQSGAKVNPQEPSAARAATSNEIGTVAATIEVRKSSGPDRGESKRKHRSGMRDDQGSKKPRVNPEEPSAVRATTSNEIGTVAATVEVRKSSGPNRGESKRKHRSGTRDDQGSKKPRVNPEEPSAVCATTSNEIGTVAATVEVRKSSGPERDGSKRKHRSGTHDDQGSKKPRKSGKLAKSEISCLAMLELKPLKIDKTYGSDRFKEVARAATHTVLASYGLEHTPSVALALPKPVCKHSCRTGSSKLSAIANTCKECLRGFVKQAISSVLASKQMDQTAASC